LKNRQRTAGFGEFLPLFQPQSYPGEEFLITGCSKHTKAGVLEHFRLAGFTGLVGFHADDFLLVVAIQPNQRPSHGWKLQTHLSCNRCQQHDGNEFRSGCNVEILVAEAASINHSP